MSNEPSLNVSSDVLGNLMEHILSTLEPSLSPQLKAFVGLVCRWDVRPPIAPNRTRYLDPIKARRLHIDDEVATGARLAHQIFTGLDTAPREAFVDMLDLMGVGIGPPGRDSMGRNTRCVHTAIGRIPFN